MAAVALAAGLVPAVAGVVGSGAAPGSRTGPAGPAAAPAPAAPPAVAKHHAGRGSATAILRLADGRRVGRVTFRPYGAHGSVVSVRLTAPALVARGRFHGFHVHANNNPANGRGCVADPAQPPSTWFVSADGHYADPGQVHGEHRGDLPVLYVLRSGRAAASSVTDRFRPRDVVGRAVVLHARADNYANIPTGSAPTQYTPNSPEALAMTAATGNAGDRLACGVIRR